MRATLGSAGALILEEAGGAFRVRCRIVVPAGNNPEKNAAARGLGARVVEEGRDYDDAVEHKRLDGFVLPGGENRRQDFRAADFIRQNSADRSH